MAGAMKYRTSAGDERSKETQRFAKAMTRIQSIEDNRGYDYIAGLHGAPGWYCWHHQFSRRSDNRAQLFLPWHRAYLHHLELALNDGVSEDEETSLLWWDWTSTAQIPEAYSVSEINGETNPLRRFRMNIESPSGNIRRFTRKN